MIFKSCIISIALSLNMTPAAVGQTRVTLDSFCVFDGSAIPDDIYGFESDKDAREALDRVMRATGLESNFVIRAANVPNAVAAIEGTQRMVLYNQAFMLRVKAETKTDWSAISILAHEIGHHLQGHTLLPGGSRPEIELQADKYSGFVLQRMGAQLEQAQAAMKLVAGEAATSTHPGREARLAAITNGWVQAKDITENKPDAKPPSEKPSPQPIPKSDPPISRPPAPSPNVYQARAVFPTDPIAYYITASNEIVGIDPRVGQPVIVGRKIPPTYPAFAWMYSTAQITYGVTADGKIMNRDQFGRPFQVGHITAP